MVLVPSNRLPDLSPSQVVALQDSLLANADRLLQGALAILELGNVGLARSLAILAMEESGKAIALHDRRVAIAYSPEGEPFVDDRVRRIWLSHPEKLALVHRFLVEERYWFGPGPPDIERNARDLGAIESWAREHNRLKQRGFYVDLDTAGEVIEPAAVPDPDTLARIIDHVHQIGWQLRLGEHIEAKGQASMAADVPPMTDKEVASLRRLVDDQGTITEEVWASMRAGSGGTVLNNSAYRLMLRGPDDPPFQTLGKPGYEAQTRELEELQNGRLPGAGAPHLRSPGPAAADDKSC
jgi:AbiV family abortive infection protein